MTLRLYTEPCQNLALFKLNAGLQVFLHNMCARGMSCITHWGVPIECLPKHTVEKQSNE